MTKKLFALLMITCLTLSMLAGCGSSSAPSSGGSPSAPAPSGGSSGSTSSSTSSSTTAPVKVIEMIMADNSNPGALRNRQFEFLKTRIEEISGGQIKINFFAGGTMFNDREVLDALMNDTCTFAFINPSNASGIVPDVGIMSLPGTYKYQGEDDRDTLIEFEREVHDTMVQIYEPIGVRYLTFMPPSNAVIINKTTQITKPDDLKGRIYRASGTWIAKLLESWGCATTQLSVADFVTSLDRGTTEGTLTSMESTITQRYFEMCPYTTLFGYADLVGSVCMSGTMWNKLTAEQQGWIQQAADEFLQEALDMRIAFLYDTLLPTWEENNVPVYRVNDEEAEAFMKNVKPIQEELLKLASPKGLELFAIIEKWKAV